MKLSLDQKLGLYMWADVWGEKKERILYVLSVL